MLDPLDDLVQLVEVELREWNILGLDRVAERLAEELEP